jgi:plasmid stability protein
MATLIIRNLDQAVKERLRVRAAEHGHSMEAEARRILQTALGQSASLPERNL